MRSCVLSADKSGATARWVYVRRRDETKLGGVEEGRYELLATLGLDWDEENRRFRQNAVYERVDKTFSFSEKQKADGVEFDKRTVILNPVQNGNLGYRRVSEAEFRGQ